MWHKQTKKALLKEVKIKKSKHGEVCLTAVVQVAVTADDRAELGVDEEQFARGGATVQWTQNLGQHDVSLSMHGGSAAMSGHKVLFDKPKLVVKLHGKDLFKKKRRKKRGKKDPDEAANLVLTGIEPPAPPKYETYLQFEIPITLIGDCRNRVWAMLDALGQVMDMEVEECSKMEGQMTIDEAPEVEPDLPEHPILREVISPNKVTRATERQLWEWYSSLTGTVERSEAHDVPLLVREVSSLLTDYWNGPTNAPAADPQNTDVPSADTDTEEPLPPAQDFETEPALAPEPAAEPDKQTTTLKFQLADIEQANDDELWGYYSSLKGVARRGAIHTATTMRKWLREHFEKAA